MSLVQSEPKCLIYHQVEKKNLFLVIWNMEHSNMWNSAVVLNVLWLKDFDIKKQNKQKNRTDTE